MATSDSGNLIIYIALGTAGILSLMMFVVFTFMMYHRRSIEKVRREEDRIKEEEERMTMARLDSTEKERIRIAVDIHDSLGSMLWGARVHASLLEKSVELPPEAQPIYKEMTTIIDQCIQAAKRISWELTPEAFTHAGLSESINSMCTRLSATQLSVTFHENETKFWNDQRALHAFRIVQELVTNGIRHSGGDRIHVELKWDQGVAEIQVTDNGKGMESRKGNLGVGLWSVRQRVHYLGAAISTGKPNKGPGTCVTISIPCKI